MTIKRLLKNIILFIIIFVSYISLANIYAINWQCWTINNTLSTPSNNNHPWLSYFFCTAWATEWISFNNTSKEWTWTCKWTDWDIDASCTYNTNTSIVITTWSCGSANNQWFSTTNNNIGDFYSNSNNKFLWKLCKDTNNKDILPTIFNSTSLGRTWNCPGSWTTCQAPRYFDARCGISANTWHTSAPNNNLCSPWYIAWPTQFDNERHLWSRQCSWWGWGNTSTCTAWLNGNNTFSPTCNTNIIKSNGSNNVINQFPWNNACIYGVLTNRQLSLWGIASWQCINNGQTSSSCGNISLVNYANSQWNSCNSSITNQTFDSTYQLLQQSLCEDGWIASSFINTNGRWKWKCWLQSCEAIMSNKPMCGRATKQPRRSYPSNGICTEGIASTIKQSNGEWGWICTTNLNNIQQFNNSSCTTVSCLLQVVDFYSGKTSICTAPRITDGECKRSTQINTNWFSDPDQVLQSWLCEAWIPEPLIPTQDIITKKRSRKCKATTALGTDSSQCYAKVKLPNLSVIYQPQSTNGTMTSVTAIVTGFNTTYITFDTPVNQYYRLFTEDWYFFFKYHDRAWNTWSVLAVVDMIQTDVPKATINMSPTTSTSWNVVVSLTNFNRPQTPIVTFTGHCLTLGTCNKNSSINPYIFTVTFNNNGTGEYKLVDENGISNTIPVVVSTIDKTPPLANLQYDNTNATNTWVRVTVINPNETIKILNNNGSTWYLFSSNGSFIFKVSDVAGNVTNLTASVNRINKNAPGANIVYSTTSNTTNNVTATLTNFTTSWIIITNNSWSISHTFTYNKEFVFILKDPAGNIGSVKAKVDWINKPITADLTNIYKNKLCPDRTTSPIDTNSQIYNYYIQTVINNCIMKTFKSTNNNRYFNPKKNITRGEYLTVIGRMITLLWNYSGSVMNSLSPNYIGITYNGIDESLLGEVDTRWLLLYSPLIKKWNKWTIESKKYIWWWEAQKILEQTLIILGNTTKAHTLIKNTGTLTRAQTAYAIGKIISQYDHTALGNHHIFLWQLDTKLSTLSWVVAKQSFMVQLIKKIRATSSQSLYKVGIDRAILLQDLSSIALGSILQRKPKQELNLNTIIDFLITKNTNTKIINNSNKTYIPTTETKDNNYFNFWSDISF